jgi:Ca2+:H+ antiporter
MAALLRWTVAVPVLAALVLLATWGTKPATVVLVLVGALLAASVLAAVHHAEVVAHRVGEPFGSLVLAVAVTVIEVALIVTLMVSAGSDTSTLARDTVFAAVMVTCNGIVGICLLIGALRHRVATFNAEGTATALATVATLATLSLVLPTFTTSQPGPEFSPAQLAFAAMASIALYALFVVVQTVRHRDYFLPRGDRADPEEHAPPPSARAALASIGLTIPAIAAASIWVEGPLVLGLGSTQIVLLVITAVVGGLTVLPGRATLQEGGVHLVLFAAFLFLAANP